MSISININSDAAVRHTARLDRLHRSALPVAVRNTLNKAAFDVKKESMPSVAKKTFVERSPNFFKANSKVTPATGFNVSSMKATVGFVSKSGNDKSVDDLEQQEHGGQIGGRSLVALKQARSGSSWNKRVRANLRMGKIRGKIIDPGKAGPKNNVKKEQAFVKSAVHAGKGGLIFGKKSVVFQIRALKRVKGNTIVKVTPIYSVERGRKARIKATNFMRKASLLSGNKMEQIFAQEAKKQIERLR